MPFYEQLFLAIALAMDAMLVSFSYGLIIHQNRLRSSLSLATSMGIGQFIFPIIGFSLTRLIGHQVQSYDHWLTFTVFLLLGIKILYDSFTDDKQSSTQSSIKALTLPIIFMLGVATSLDALAAGTTLFFTQTAIWPCVTLIGFIAFMFSIIGFFCTHLLQCLPKHIPEIMAALFLFALALKSLIEA